MVCPQLFLALILKNDNIYPVVPYKHSTGVKTIRRFFFIFLFIASVIGGGSSSADNARLFEDAYHAISSCILSGKYSEAEAIADSLIRKYPEEPAAALFKASIIQYECLDYEDPRRDGELIAFIDRASATAREKLKRNPSDVWADYFLSSSYGLKGAHASAAGRLLYGISMGWYGARGMFRIIERDSTMYDAYLLAGSSLFWKSVETARFSWLPFIGDDRERGISYVRKAVSEGKLTGPLSNTVLLEMLLSYDPAGAAVLGETFAQAYPSCRLFAWQLGEAYKILNRYEDAVRMFSGIAESYRAEGRDDGSGELRCWWKLAVLAKSLRKREDCIRYCNKVIELGKKDSVGRKQRERIEKARTMLGELTHE